MGPVGFKRLKDSDIIVKVSAYSATSTGESHTTLGTTGAFTSYHTHVNNATILRVLMVKQPIISQNFEMYDTARK